MMRKMRETVVLAVSLILAVAVAVVACSGQYFHRPRNPTKRQGGYYQERVCGPDNSVVFTYQPNSPNGPEHWFRQSPCCAGQRQSPIDLDLRTATCNTALIPVYTGPFSLEGILYNTGHDVTLRLYDLPQRSLLRNVGTRGDAWPPSAYLTTFVLHNLHVHFGGPSLPGSEHTINGQGYDAEIHLVHYNSKYGSLENAMVHRDGVAVVAVLLSRSGQPNGQVDQLFTAAGSLRGIGESSGRSFTLFPADLLGSNPKLYFYRGSLTTPTCSESVQFIVLQQPLLITQRQLEALWQLPSDMGGTISKYGSVRPLQPSNKRPVYTSFPCWGK